jgi:hypothetical protein
LQYNNSETYQNETDFSLVFHPLRACTTTPPDKQPPSYEEKENVFKQKNRNVKGKTKINTNFEASHSLSLTSENCNYMVESKVQTLAQVPLEDLSDPSIGCRSTMAKYEGPATQNQCLNAGKTTTKIKTKIKTITNKKGRENSKLPELPDGECTEIAKKLHKKPKNIW